MLVLVTSRFRVNSHEVPPLASCLSLSFKHFKYINKLSTEEEIPSSLMM